MILFLANFCIKSKIKKPKMPTKSNSPHCEKRNQNCHILITGSSMSPKHSMIPKGFYFPLQLAAKFGSSIF